MDLVRDLGARGVESRMERRRFAAAILSTLPFSASFSASLTASPIMSLSGCSIRLTTGRNAGGTSAAIGSITASIAKSTPDDTFAVAVWTWEVTKLVTSPSDWSSVAPSFLTIVPDDVVDLTVDRALIELIAPVIASLICALQGGGRPWRGPPSWLASAASALLSAVMVCLPASAPRSAGTPVRIVTSSRLPMSSAKSPVR